MRKVGIALSINVSMIEKARLFDGKKGKYLSCTVFVDTDELDKYGNSGMITQDVTKEERASKVQGPILGNAKVFWKETAIPNAQPADTHKAGVQQPAGFDGWDEQIPF